MGQDIRLVADDGHELTAHRADPLGDAIGGIVIIQEILGVNVHIRSICDDFAAKGYAAVAPQLYDRFDPNLVFPPVRESTPHARLARQKLSWEEILADTAAAAGALSPISPLAIVGYCFGGSVAWLGACRLNFDAAVCYYGGQIVEFAHETSGCPVMMHFGEIDHLISFEDVASIRSAQPSAVIHTYPDAAHAFNNDIGPNYHPEAALLSRERTADFLEERLGTTQL